jgi:hypothetical protein
VGTIIKTLRELNVAEDDYVYLNYEESVSVWHITDDYIETALGETTTASMLAGLLACPGNITVLSRYEEDILDLMRGEGLLDAYEHDGFFEVYLTETIREKAYEYDLLTISTERHDHKRGACEVASNVKVLAGELYNLGDRMADVFVAGFDIVVQTKNGLLTLT